MTHDVIATCPVCSKELTVTRLQCRGCGTSIEGEFNVGRFGRLGRDQMGLLESFLRARGNLREMERELRLSYPTVRARVDALVRALGLWEGEAADLAEAADTTGDGGPGAAAMDVSGEAVSRPDATEARHRILERLARHELSAEDAAAAIRALGGND